MFTNKKKNINKNSKQDKLSAVPLRVLRSCLSVEQATSFECAYFSRNMTRVAVVVST